MSFQYRRLLNYLPFLKQQLNEIYWVHAIDTFAFSLIGIFIPIYLLTLGYALTEVILFYIVQYLSIPFFSFIAEYLARHFGLKHVLLARVPFLFLPLIMLSALDIANFPILIIAILMGFQMALYWIPLHSLFAKSIHNQYISTEVSKLELLPKITTAIAPIIGGFIALFFGFNLLLIIVMALLIISVIPLFYTREVKPHTEIQLRDGYELLKKYPKNFCVIAINNLTDVAEHIIWPIFIFLTVYSILSIGMIGTFFGLGAVILTIIIGKLSDQFDKKIVLKVGALLMILLWFARSFVNREAAIYLTAMPAGFFSALTIVPFQSLTYQLAKKYNTVEFIVFREIPVAVGRITILLVALLALSKLHITFFVTSIVHFFIFFF